VDGADEDPWSEVADGWAELWAGSAAPAWTPVLRAAAVAAGDWVLDVGCGSGELLAHLDGLGMVTAGIDAAEGMVARAQSLVPAADVRIGSAEALPWSDDIFDLVVAVNVLELVDDPDDAFAELVRVTAPQGTVAVVNWAEASRNDLDTIERAVTLDAGDEPRPDGEVRLDGGHERLFRRGGLEVVESGIVAVPWSAPDDATLVRAVLLGEDEATTASIGEVVVAAAERFRTPAGGYRLLNHFRYAVGRASASTR